MKKSARATGLMLILSLTIASLAVTLTVPLVSAPAVGDSEFFLSSTSLAGFGTDYRKLATSNQTGDTSTKITYDTTTGNYTFDPLTTRTPPLPQLPNAGVPQLNTTVNATVANVSSVASCHPSLNLSTWEVVHNNTGSETTVTGAFSNVTVELWNFTLTLNDTAGIMVYFRARVNDTDNVWSMPSWRNVTLGATQPSQPPYINNLAANTTAAGMPVNITGSASDDSGLSHWRIGCNNTGSWVNQSWSVLASTNFNWQTTLNDTLGGVLIRFQVWVNDTHGQLSTNEMWLRTLDTIPPSSTALRGFGWRTDGVYGAVIAPTVWRFNLTITSNAIADVGHIEIYAYKCNTTGGDVTNLFSIDGSGTDVLVTSNPGSLLSKFEFTAFTSSSVDLTDRILVFEYWLEVTSATAGAGSTATLTIGGTAHGPEYPDIDLTGADMELSDVSLSSNVAIAGVPIDVTVNITNYGPDNASATVSVSAKHPDILDPFIIQVWTVENLTVGSWNSTTRSWDTTTYVNGTYLITARVAVIAGPPPPDIDHNSANNVLQYGNASIKRYDVALAGVDPVFAYPTGVSAGTPVYINASVTNEGGYSATTTVTPYYGIPGSIPWTVAASGVAVTLAPGETKEEKFTWSTTGLSNGNYQFKANLTHVTNEYDFADNSWSPDDTVNIPAVHDVSVLSFSKNATYIRLGLPVQINATVANEGDTPNTETLDVTPYYDSVVAATTQSVVLSARSTTKDPYPSQKLTFIWDTSTADYGDYTLKVVVDEVSGETDTADNTWFDGSVSTPRVYLDPATYIYSIGQTFDVAIKIERCPELYSWEFNITYDPNILTPWGNGGGFTNGSFLSSQITDGTFFVKNIGGVWPTDLGWIYGTETGLGNTEAVGSGTLATLNFTVDASGTSSIELHNDILVHLGPAPGYEITQYPADEYSIDYAGFTTNTLIGDINKDGIVNVMDLATIAVAYGTTTGDPLWNPDADIAAPYGEITIADLATCAQQYGKYV